MTVETTGRAQAHIEKIVSVDPIKGADRIEVVQVLGWECIVQKIDGFKVGDYCIYIEIDSVVPPIPEFEFLESRKYRVRTIKLRKQLSQGLVLPIKGKFADMVGEVVEGKDVTEALGVKKYDPQIRAEKRNRKTGKKRSWLMRKLMRWAWFRAIVFWFKPSLDKDFPNWIPKSDETRVQAKPSYLRPREGKKYYISEKLEGQSTTIFYKPSEKCKKRYGVCSRNIRLDPNEKGNWQYVAKKYDLENKLKDPKILKEFSDGISVQGEIIGPGIQKNIYKLEDWELHLFNVYDNAAGKYVPLDKLKEVAKTLGVPVVPILDEDFDLSKYDLKTLLKFAEAKSVMPNCKDVEREGIVIRTHDQVVSFKAISNKYLLEKASVEDAEEELFEE